MGVPFLVHVCGRRWRFWELWSSVSWDLPFPGGRRGPFAAGLGLFFARVSDDFWSVSWVLDEVGIVLRKMRSFSEFVFMFLAI